MGIDRTSLNAILMSCRHIKNKQNLLTIGRQQIHTSQENNIDIGDKFNTNLSEIIYGNYCETFFSSVGFINIDSIDNSNYEGSKYIHNLNYPILEDFKNKYDYIYDGGTTEHLFNIPQVFKNIIDMLNIDGLFVSVTCNNNFSGHGMYQFSPELYLSCFNQKYGMEIIDMYIAEVGTTNNEWKNVNSFNGYRNIDKFNSTLETYIIIIARKISNERESLIKNSPNQYSYDEHDWKKYTNKIDITYSQASQDVFVINLLQHKKNGYFVEIGTNDPIECNNTYLLESQFNWKGISIDSDLNFVEQFNNIRSNKCLHLDATNADYDKIIQSSNLGLHIDFLQLDIDPPDNTFKVLTKIDFAKYSFSVITYEHDLSSGGKEERIESRKIIESHGYTRVIGDVMHGDVVFEDWYINEKYMPNNNWKQFVGENIKMDVGNINKKYTDILEDLLK